MVEERRRIGLVGTSYWIEQVHGPAAAASPHWDLAAVWGRSPDRVERVADSLRCKGITDFDAFLDHVDAVLFAVPPDVQAELAVRAAGRGKHVMLEKPMALSAARAGELEDAVRQAGVASVVFFTSLWMPRMSAYLEGLRVQGGWESGRYAFVAALPAEALEASPWRATSGGLWDVGPHVLSVLERVLGRVREVQALAGKRDHLQLVFSHESGATSSAEVTVRAPRGDIGNAVSFWGEHGTSAPAEPPTFDDIIAGSGAAMAALAEQARTGTRGAGIDVEYGAHVVRVLAAAERSVASRSVEVPV